MFRAVDPWNVSISGPDVIFVGSLSQFTCLASCTINVDCTVKWQFRNGFPVGTYLSVSGNNIKWTPSIPGTFQNFTCVAENKVIGRSAEDTKMVEVRGTDEFFLLSSSNIPQHTVFKLLTWFVLFVFSSLSSCSSLWIRTGAAQWTVSDALLLIHGSVNLFIFEVVIIVFSL